MTPYREHADLTRAVVLDGIDDDATVDVGTVHRFQGREFDTVVFDTVEDGITGGWVAHARLDPGDDRALSGMRVFNVAVTHAKRRVYVVLNGSALRKRGGRALAALAGAVRERINSARKGVWMWSPWVGKHAVALQDALLDAQERGVRIRLFALPPAGLQSTVPQSLEDIRGKLDHIVRIRRMHQKIVVVDTRWTLVGSINLLSHGETPSRRRGEVMVQIDNRHFAENMLRHQRAHVLEARKDCGACGHRMSEVRSRRRNGRVSWERVCGCIDERRPSTVPIPGSDACTWHPLGSG